VVPSFIDVPFGVLYTNRIYCSEYPDRQSGHNAMRRDRLKKIFGVGPLGAVISFGLLAVAAGIDRFIGFAAITRYTAPVHLAGGLLVALGLGLHGWSFMTLRAWWGQSRLCTHGPFRYLRHPMYAAWISLIAPGTVLILNHFIYWVWLLALHVIWHALVRREEATMYHLFGETYRTYASRTGRFLPRWPHRTED
jgi:protein-S-isoprenylcysteine O-methyltransferase Ste14